MEAAKFHAWLKDAGGCADCRSWSKGLDLLTIWNTCERGGKAYWLKVKENRPETFAQRVALEEQYGHTILKDTTLAQLAITGLKREVRSREAIDIGSCECGS